MLDGGAYRPAPESAAFPGWKREEIYGALMEEPWSDSTRRAVDRVARAMGAREGTRPEDDPLSRSLLREGHAQGREEGEAPGRAAMVRELLRSRGVATSPDFEESLPALAGATPAAALTAAALACTSEAELPAPRPDARFAGSAPRSVAGTTAGASGRPREERRHTWTPYGPRLHTEPPKRPPLTAVGTSGRSARYGPEDFPGCEAFHLPAAELEAYEGRLEFWDGRTHTAWRVSEGASVEHEEPVGMLPYAMRELAALRGSPVKCFGSASLVRLDASGRTRWLMQADQVLYLHPERSRPYGPDIDVDRDPLPDVVLEVDYTTDVRRRKLGIYLETGFPEVWVLVPPGSRRAGYPRVTIHVLDGGGVSGGAGERGVSGLEARGDLRRPDGGAVVGLDQKGSGPGGAGDGRARRHGAGGRSVLALADPRGEGTGPCASPPRRRGTGPCCDGA